MADASHPAQHLSFQGMQIASCKLPVEHLSGHCADPWLPGRQPGREEQCGVGQVEWYGSSGSTFSAQRILPSEHNFWFTLYPQSPAFFRLNCCRGATMETLRSLGGAGFPTLHPRQPGHRFPSGEGSQRVRSLGPSSLPSSGCGSPPASLLIQLCTSQQRSVERQHPQPCLGCSCWAGWVGPGDLHVKALLVLTMSLYVNLFPGKVSRNQQASTCVYPQGQLK